MRRKYVFIHPNQSGGIVDYVNLIDERLRSAHWNIEKKSRLEARDVFSTNTYFFLQYSPYGFNSKGVPIALVLFYMFIPKKRKCVFFHEVAIPKDNRYKYRILRAVQIFLAKLVFLSSSRAFCNSEVWLKIIKNKPGELIQIGVPSNIPRIYGFNTNRQTSQIVAFGGVDRRISVYEKLLTEGTDFNHLYKIVDIGSTNEYLLHLIDLVKTNCKVIFEILGNIPSHRVSQIMANSYFGLFCYESDYLTKSGILASYMLHELVPVNVFVSSRHYVPLNEMPYPFCLTGADLIYYSTYLMVSHDAIIKHNNKFVVSVEDHLKIYLRICEESV